jgi:hypothetical protein
MLNNLLNSLKFLSVVHLQLNVIVTQLCYLMVRWIGQFEIQFNILNKNKITQSTLDYFPHQGII